MPNGAKHWCFTLNNYTDEEQQRLRDFATTQFCSYIVFGRETGEGGTPHLQGFLSLSVRKPLPYLRGNVNDRAHWESARGTPKQASDYCKKDGDFEEFGTIPRGRGTTSSVQEAQEYIRSYVDEHGRVPTRKELADNHPTAFIHHRRGLEEYGRAICPQPVIRGGPVVLRDWQDTLEQTLEDPADDRTVSFYVDPEGNAGKTFFMQYYLGKRDDAQMLSIGKRDDLAHAIDPTKRVFFINVPRGSIEYLQYSILEGLKDRLIFSPKYDSRTKVLSFTPHVIVFCNEHPDMNALSADRYNIITF